MVHKYYFFFTSLIFVLATGAQCMDNQDPDPCKPTDILVRSAPAGRIVAGKTEWIVFVQNTCLCSVGGIVLSCPDFQTVEPIDQSIFQRTGDGRCLINQGRDLQTFEMVQFRYAWDTSFNLPVQKTLPQC